MRHPFLFLLLCVCAFATAQPRVSVIGGVQNTSISPFLSSQPHQPYTLTNNEIKGNGLRFGFMAHLPFKEGSALYFQPGVVYGARNTTHEQMMDTSLTSLYKITNELKLNYIDVPFNLLIKLRLKGKTSFLLGAGPQASLFYTGKWTTSSLDTALNFKIESANEDLPVGKEEEKYKVLHFSANAVSGFEFGRVSIMVHYSKSLTPFYQSNGSEYQSVSMGATLGILLGKAAPVKKQATPVNNDHDKDGIPNLEDKCPDQPGSKLTNGCPDNDGDGIANTEDQCADVAGVVRYNGCPVPDSDQDGLNDEQDKCPQIAGVNRYDGCPVPDTDKDGVNDEEDKCPKETGTKENAGCPKAEIKKEVIEKVNTAARKIQFEYRKDELTPSSLPVLNEVVKILKENPGLNITIEGHTSGDGDPVINQKLSQRRADRVKQYLITKGIDAGRITAIGYGPSRPLSAETSEQAKAANRRVEMKLSQQ